jgi:MiaB-like tRNA modifying enzyme
MSNLLKGFPKAGSEEDADIIIVNTCVVKEPTENKIIKYLEDLPRDKRVIITGCMPRTSTRLLRNKFEHSLVGCDNIFDIVNVVNGMMKESLEPRKIVRVGVVPIQKNPVIEIIPVCQGCLGECTYCITKYARGDLFSYKPSVIFSHVRGALKRGVREFWFTAQDTGAYGKDIKTNIIELLKKVIRIKGFFKIRLGMMNPVHALKLKKGLVEVLNHEKLFKFIHLPVQSGSNRILDLMKRDYTSEEFIELCNYLKKRVPDLTISTDIIVGFPSETEQDFRNTLKLVKIVKPDVLNLSRFWKRRLTKASLLEQVNVSVVKSRVKRLESLHKKIALRNNKAYLNKVVNVLIDEEGRARSDSYKIIKGVNGVLGRYKKCLIVKVTSSSLVGKVL